MNELKDVRGLTVEVGDTIAYPVRRGSSMWLNHGKVEALTYEAGLPRSPWRVKVRVGERLNTIRAVSKLVVVEKAEPCSQSRPGPMSSSDHNDEEADRWSKTRRTSTSSWPSLASGRRSCFT